MGFSMHCLVLTARCFSDGEWVDVLHRGQWFVQALRSACLKDE